jgi:hypothetical protein
MQPKRREKFSQMPFNVVDFFFLLFFCSGALLRSAFLMIMEVEDGKVLLGRALKSSQVALGCVCDLNLSFLLLVAGRY